MSDAAARLSPAGAVDRLVVTRSGFFLAFGWVDDEGLEAPRWSLGDAAGSAAALRGARAAAPAGGQSPGVGFRLLGRADPGDLMRDEARICAAYGSAGFEAAAAPEAVADRRLLDAFLEAVAGETGGEADLHDFLAGPGGEILMALVARCVAAGLADPYVETFGARPVERAFVTALAGSADPVASQPLLFRRHRIEFGQWVYVCRSAEVGERALDRAKSAAALYCAMITVVVLGDDAGFGPACDLGVAQAQAEGIALVGPDVYPVPAYASLTRAALAQRDLGEDLWGGLLFADDHTLASDSVRFVRETHARRRPGEPGAGAVVWTRAIPAAATGPFREGRAPAPVAAISEAFMGFAKRRFERVGGFSSRCVYQGGEGVDLSLRWAEAGGRVLVDPGLRWLRLDGYPFGDSARRGAAIVNRGLFALRAPRLGARSAA